MLVHHCYNQVLYSIACHMTMHVYTGSWWYVRANYGVELSIDAFQNIFYRYNYVIISKIHWKSFCLSLTCEEQWA